MIGFFKFFHGYLQVRLTGYSPERFLNLCSSRNIILWDLSPVPNGYEFFISIQAFRQLRPLLKKTGTRIHILHKSGIPFLAFRYRRHKFFFVGFLLFLGLLFGMSRFIWDVQIEGNSYFSDQTLTQYLADQKIGYGCRKKSLDCSGIEEQMRTDYPDIIWVSAKIQGTRLLIEIQEAAAEKNTQETKERGMDLIAGYDGVVTSIMTRAGTPCVKRGDRVKKGDILVSGCLEILDDAGEVSGYQYCEADADVKIETGISYEDKFPKTVTQYEETGQMRRTISFLGEKKRLFLRLRPNTFQHWDALTETASVRIGADFYLPFQLEKTRIRELRPVEHTYTKEEAEQLAGERLEVFCRAFTEKGFEILEKSVKIKSVKNGFLVSGQIRMLEHAQKMQETKIRTVKSEEGQE